MSQPKKIKLMPFYPPPGTTWRVMDEFHHALQYTEGMEVEIIKWFQNQIDTVLKPIAVKTKVEQKVVKAETEDNTRKAIEAAKQAAAKARRDEEQAAFERQKKEEELQKLLQPAEELTDEHVEAQAQQVLNLNNEV